MTSGNHIWDKKEALDYIGAEPRLLRPANYPAGAPGNGSYLAAHAGRPARSASINVMGRVFMPPHRRSVRGRAATRSRRCASARAIIFVDFHAEATSEKVAMGWHLDGKVTAVVGTHTHVQTADERILPKGTAYLTDVGMTGPHDSIIGVEIEAGARPVPDRPAGAVRDGHRQPAAERRPHRRRRRDRPRHRHRAPQLQRWTSSHATCAADDATCSICRSRTTGARASDARRTPVASRRAGPRRPPRAAVAF